MLKSKMRLLPFKENNVEIVIIETLKILENGGIIAYPTESFYALGALATDESVVRRIYELKKRPIEKPLPIIVGDMNTLKSVVRSIPFQARGLMERFWPGPLTMVFKAQSNLPELLTGGTDKVAVRIPGESVALYLARATKFPITATSANPSTRPPAQKSDEVINYFGDNIDLVIDIGKTSGGKPSTIVDVTVIPPRILREGRIELETNR